MHTLNQTVIHRLHHHIPQKLSETPLTAAVMILLHVDENDNVTILLTKRTATLATYAGHYSFPGGMRDEQDENLWETAKREVYEELTITSEDYEFIGELDDFYDRFGNVVRPFVALLHPTNKTLFTAFSPAEVESLYFFPLSNLHQLEDNPELHHITNRRPSYTYTEADVFIWGLTAGILVRFREVIFG